MDTLFGQSELGRRDKWRNREDYRRRSIDAAIEQTTATYDPARIGGFSRAGAIPGESQTTSTEAEEAEEERER